jgi:hypothetical protein
MLVTTMATNTDKALDCTIPVASPNQLILIAYRNSGDRRPLSIYGNMHGSRIGTWPHDSLTALIVAVWLVTFKLPVLGAQHNVAILQ